MGVSVYISGNNFGPIPDTSDTCVPADSGAILASYSNNGIIATSRA